MSGNLHKSRRFFYSLLLLLGVFYWCFDSAWSYISYERNLNDLLFMVPSSFLDTFFLKVSPYQTVSRLGVLTLLLLSSSLLIELSFRKQKVANALLESEKRYQHLMAHADVGVSIVQDRTFKIANPKFLEITGYSKEKMAETQFTDVIHRDDRAMTIGWYRQAMAGKNPVTDTPFQILTSEQKIKWLQLNTTQIFWENKPALLCVLHDVTRRKIKEEKRQQTKKMEAIGLLAGGVAHDLNNILSGIVSYPELLLKLLPDDSPLASHVETMHEAGLRASAVVADLLTVARGVVSNRHVVDFNVLAEEFLATPECQVLQERYPEVVLSSSFHQKPIAVLCSEIHIHKSLMNLMVNAFEAIDGENGSITLTTDWKDLSEAEALRLNLQAGSHAILSVSDTGPGISAEQKEHLFEPFFTRKTMGRSGTGLGLTVVWNTIVDHDGAIDIITSGRGTTFSLYLPSSHLSNISGESVTGSKIPAVHEGAAERILIVDDEAQQREIGTQFLSLMKYRPESVASGEDAIEFLRHDKVDLVILDMVMDPGINGRETYEQILALHPAQKALIISGYAGHDEITRAMKLGVGGLLKKPYTFEQLAGAVAKELKRV